MDNTALQALIAEVRGTIAVLAEADQKVAVAKAALARQIHGWRAEARADRSIEPSAKVR
jgi:hypothetical protein